MRPSRRDKRIRTGAGLAIISLAILSVILAFAPGRDHSSELSRGVLYGLPALFTLGAGTYLAVGRGKAAALVLFPGRWQRIGLAAYAVVGTAAIVFGFIAGPEALMTTAFWPFMMGIWILMQFRPMTGRFRQEERWTTGLPVEAALDSLAEAFRQPGLRTRRMGQDLWVEIGRDWMGGNWLHEDAARHLKSVIGLHFRIDDVDGGTHITAHSGDRSVEGLYDVQKLSDEMNTTVVELARQVTTRHHDGTPS